MCQSNVARVRDLELGLEVVLERGLVLVSGRGLERLGERQHRARRGRPLEQRVVGRVGGVLHRDEVRLAVAAAVDRLGVRGGALVLGDDVRERRVEVAAAAVVERVGDVVAADLEREPEPAGGVIAPVLGPAAGVVELVAGLVQIAVLGRHPGAEALVELLVGRQRVAGEARRAQDQVRERVVGDQGDHLARGDQLADVLRLRLRERARAAVVLVDRDVARPRAAPEAAVVAVRVDTGRLDPDRRLRAVAALAVVEEATVLAPVLVRRGREVGQEGAVLAVGVAVELARLARGVEAVRVDDRDHDRARALDQPGDPRVAGVVAVDELVGPLHRVLARGPLAGVVDAHLQEHRLAVADRVHVGGDLDPLDRAPLVGLVGERDRAHQVGIRGREVLHLLVVVGEVAVGRALARQRRLLDPGREALVRGLLRGALAGEVGDLDLVVEADLVERLAVSGAVEDDGDVAGSAVLGQVESERGEQLLVACPRGLDEDERGPAALGVGKRLAGERERGLLAGAGEPAGLNGERAVVGDEARGDLVRSRRGGGGHTLAGRVEDRDVPVRAGRRLEADLDRGGVGAGERRLERHRGGARSVADEALDAAAVDRLGDRHGLAGLARLGGARGAASTRPGDRRDRDRRRGRCRDCHPAPNQPQPRDLSQVKSLPSRSPTRAKIRKRGRRCASSPRPRPSGSPNRRRGRSRGSRDGRRRARAGSARSASGTRS